MLQCRKSKAGELSGEFYSSLTRISVLLGGDGMQREVFPCYRQFCLSSLPVKFHSSEYLCVAGAECSKLDIRGFEMA